MTTASFIKIRGQSITGYKGVKGQVCFFLRWISAVKGLKNGTGLFGLMEDGCWRNVDDVNVVESNNGRDIRTMNE